VIAACNDNLCGSMSKQGLNSPKARVAKTRSRAPHTPVPTTQLEALKDFARRYRNKIGSSQEKALEELKAMGITDDAGQITPGFGGQPDTTRQPARRTR
jgi:hypothetical protein